MPMPDPTPPKDPAQEMVEELRAVTATMMDLAKEVREVRLETEGARAPSGKEYQRRESDQRTVSPSAIVQAIVVALLVAMGGWVWTMETRVTSIENNLIPLDTRQGIMSQLVQLNTQMSDVRRRLDNIERRSEGR